MSLAKTLRERRKKEIKKRSVSKPAVGRQCIVCGGTNTRLHIVVDSQGSKRRRTKCFNPNCKAERG